MRANRERGKHGTENASSCSGPNGEAIGDAREILRYLASCAPVTDSERLVLEAAYAALLTLGARCGTRPQWAADHATIRTCRACGEDHELDDAEDGLTDCERTEDRAEAFRAAERHAAMLRDAKRIELEREWAMRAQRFGRPAGEP